MEDRVQCRRRPGVSALYARVRHGHPRQAGLVESADRAGQSRPQQQRLHGSAQGELAVQFRALTEADGASIDLHGEAIMKKFLFGGVALATLAVAIPARAADLLLQAPTSVPVYNWSTCY